MRISDWSSDVCSSDLWPSSPALSASQHHLHPIRRGIEHGGLTPLDRSSNPRTSAMSRLLSRLSISLIAVVAACGTTVPAHAQSWAESWRSEEHTSELQSLMRISYAVFCLKKKNTHNQHTLSINHHE